MRSGPELYAWLASLPPAERDRALERELGIDVEVPHAPPGAELVGYHATSVAAIVRMLHAVPVRADDVVVDLGAGLGKVLALTHRLTGATVRGIEIQSELVSRSAADARVELSDARSAAIDDATVIFMYCPFSGAVLREVVERLDACRGPLVICALGVDLPLRRHRARPSDDFWMTVWDSGPPRSALPLPPLAQAIAQDGCDRDQSIDPVISDTSPSRPR